MSYTRNHCQDQCREAFLLHVPKDIWKDAHCHLSLGTCKTKLQWESSAYLLGWLLSIKQKTSVGMDTEKLEVFCTVGEYKRWSCYRKQYGVSSRN